MSSTNKDDIMVREIKLKLVVKKRQETVDIVHNEHWTAKYRPMSKKQAAKGMMMSMWMCKREIGREKEERQINKL